MAVARAATEESRERKIALFWTLVRAHETNAPITQEEIVANLMVDVHPVVTKVPRRRLAYEGSDNARRQKFERDKAAIRELGFEITTTRNDAGVDAYSIDPTSAFVPPLDFAPDELAVLSWATQLLGVGSSGVGRIFAEGPVAPRGVEFSPVMLPLTRAAAEGRVVRFRYRKDRRAGRVREVAPLEFLYWRGRCYLVGVDRDGLAVKGFAVSRIEGVPSVGEEKFSVDDAVRDLARSWVPRPEEGGDLEVRLEASADFARTLEGGSFTIHTSEALDRVELTGTFESPESARRAVLALGDHVWGLRPRSLREELTRWLEGVNRPRRLAAPPRFMDEEPRQDTLAQTLRLIAAVYQSPEPLSAAQLADRCGLDVDLVRSIMSRLMALQYLRDPTQYLVHIEPGEDADEPGEDPLYARSASYERSLGAIAGALTWRDAFELTVALREAAALYPGEALARLMDKLERAVPTRVRVIEVEPSNLSAVRDAIDRHEELKVEYWSQHSDSASVHWVEPRAMASRNGRWYFRAYCRTRQAWLTFRVDRILTVLAAGPADGVRPPDQPGDWVDAVADEGRDVVVALPEAQRWLLEGVPAVQWGEPDGGYEFARLRVLEDGFLDRLMVEAGPGAFVIDPEGSEAGRELARRMLRQL